MFKDMWGVYDSTIVQPQHDRGEPLSYEDVQAAFYAGGEALAVMIADWIQKTYGEDELPAHFARLIREFKRFDEAWVSRAIKAERAAT
jgi:hypothetical protein